MYYYHTDHLGTPQALTDEQGQLALEMDYQAWGQAREVIADAAGKAGIRNPFRFQGQYHDDESGCTTTAIVTMIRRSGSLFRGIRLD
ncbi:Uncharacterized conserved protein [Chromobacterium violaceum]|uniref:Uncharacterized conserved protein n=1 Tax=Chromobacterium violaceum TaxID=536 RepID=A0A3S4HGU4_CHRVL|nr:Uncharacterized conserved protein [Chromobacterium violaceum]